MSYFETVIRPRIITATHINHYPQINRLEFMEGEKTLTVLYTEKSSQELCYKYQCTVNSFTRSNKYYKFKLKLIIQWN